MTIVKIGVTTCLLLFSAAVVGAQENVLGEKLVEHYRALSEGEKKPGGSCYDVAHKRVSAVVAKVCGASAALPAISAFQSFDRIWASKNDPKTTWLNLDAEYRGKGAAGAMALLGRGTFVEEEAIWKGKLLPGAVLQTWELDADFARVKDGSPATNLGHSFIFLKYERDANGAIVGMQIADQGTSWAAPNVLNRSTFEYWVGANIRCP